MAYSRSHTPQPGYYRPHSRASVLPQSHYAPALDGSAWHQQLQKYGERAPHSVYDGSQLGTPYPRHRTPMLADETGYVDPYYGSQVGVDPYATSAAGDWGGWPGPRPSDYSSVDAYGTTRPYYDTYQSYHDPQAYYPSDYSSSTDTATSYSSPTTDSSDITYGPIPSPMHTAYSTPYGTQYDEYGNLVDGYTYGRGRSHSRSRYRCICGSKHCRECERRRRGHRSHSRHRSSSRSRRGRSSSVTVLRVNPDTSSSRSSKRVRFSGLNGSWTVPELKRLTKMVKYTVTPSWFNWRPRNHY